MDEAVDDLCRPAKQKHSCGLVARCVEIEAAAHDAHIAIEAAETSADPSGIILAHPALANRRSASFDEHAAAKIVRRQAVGFASLDDKADELAIAIDIG